jgi:hypothetical protein
MDTESLPHLSPISIFPCRTNTLQNFTFPIFLNVAPYLNNSHGTGKNANAMNAITEFPHPSPRRSYIGSPAKGNTAPPIDCNTLVAAIAEAEYLP